MTEQEANELLALIRQITRPTRRRCLYIIGLSVLSMAISGISIWHAFSR